jgi:hypothetical protein
MQDFDLQLQQQQQQQQHQEQQEQEQYRPDSPDIITYPYPLCKTEEERLKAMALKPNQARFIFLKRHST